MDAAGKSEVRDIIITHFVNPHQFWFKHDNCLINEKLLELDRRILEYFLPKQRIYEENPSYSPKRNEIVAVFDVPQNRWLRATVDDIFKYSNNDEYVLWAIDYGIPYMSSAKFIRPIPEDLASFDIGECVFFGGLNNILPAEKAFDFATSSTTFNITKNWSEKAIKTCENIFSMSYTSTFYIEKYYNRQYFGKLNITTYTNKNLNMENVLIDINDGISKTENFYKILDEYALNKTPRWLKSNGKCNLFNNNTMKNTMNFTQSITKENHLEEEIDTENQLHTNEKVKNWQEKHYQSFVTNNNMINYDNIDLISVVNKSETFNQLNDSRDKKIELEDSIKINDTIVDSNYVEKLAIIPPAQENDSTIVAGFDLDDCNLTEAIKKSSITDTPPKPSLSVNDDKQSISSINTNVSVRRAKALRKYQKTKENIKEIPGGYDLSKLNKEINDDNKMLSSNMCSIQSTDKYKMPTVIKQTIAISSESEILTETSNSSNRYKSHELPESSLNYTRPRTTQQRIKVDNTLHNVNEVCAPTSSIGKDSVLVHGSTPIPIGKIADANFTSDIHAEMERLGITKIYRTQQYAWPHLGRLNSLVLINSKSSGKTYSYLPMICSLINMQKDDDQIIDSVGPIGIIIVPFRSEAETLFYHCRRLTKKNVICTGERNKAQAIGGLFYNADLLIATPEGINLLTKSETKCFNQKRLKHLIIENLNLWNDESREILKDVFKRFQSNVQIVVTSQTWDPTLEKLLTLKSLNNPLLCIGAHIEAAVYAKVNFKLIITEKQLKMSVVVGFIKKHHYKNENIIILCNNDNDVEEVTQTLKMLGHIVQTCTTQLLAEDINDIKSLWNNNLKNDNILVTTDEILVQLQIQNAQHLIHYSLGTSWTRTCYRFSVFLKFYTDRVKDPSSNQSCATTLILLDEENNDQLPKIIKFLERGSQIDPEIKKIAEKIDIEREKRKSLISRPLCEEWLEFSKIHDKTRCDKRHLILYNDAALNDLPCKGFAEIQIISCESPIHYCVRLLRHKLHDNAEWQISRQSNEYVKFHMDFALYYSNIDNHELYDPILNDLCVVKDNDKYERGRIIEISKMRQHNVKARIKLIDRGQLNTYRTEQLLFLHDKFKDFPPQAVDLYLTDVIPYDNEENWEKKITVTVKNWIEKYKNDQHRFIAYINFSLSNIIYADEILIQEYLPLLNKLFIKKNAILKQMLKKIDDDDSNEIRTLSEEFLYINEQSLNKPTNDANVPKDKKEYQIFDHNNKIPKHSDISITISNSSLYSNDDITQKRDPEFSAVERARPNRTKKSIIKNVDESIQEVKENLIIEEIWQMLNENEFTNISISKFYSPNNFYIANLQDYEKFQLLYKKIDDFISNGAELVRNPIIGGNYLGKISEKYYRCKITSLNCDINGVLANIFFCDEGLIEKCKITDLRTTNSEITNLLPFQAIRCSLIGIISKHVDGHWTEEECDDIFKIIDSQKLYARPMIEDVQNKDDILKYRKYDVILIKNSDTQVNKEIVKLGYAIKDPDTAHYLDVVYNKQYYHKYNHDDNSYEEEDWEDDPLAQPYDFKSVLSLNQSVENNDFNQNKFFDVNFTEEELLEFYNIDNKSLPHPNDFNSVAEQVKTEKDTSSKINTQLQTVQNRNEKMQTKNVNKMPNFKKFDKIPKVVWQQSEDLICLKIYAPDINDYVLQVTISTLIFITLIDGERNVLLLNLFACIDPTIVSHEIRGLNVIIRLLKKVRGKRFSWPCLIKETIISKHNWLQYNYESIIVEHEKFENSVQPKRCIDFPNDSDSEYDETYNNIANPEDVYTDFEDD